MVDPGDAPRLLAFEEIRQLAARYALHLDARDLDALVGLFVDDVRAGRGAVGREALKASFAAQLPAGSVSFLHVGGHVIDLVDEDHATGTVHCTAELGDEHEWVRQAIAYEDTYERRDGRWYFVRRDHHLFYGERTASPLAQPDADWPASIVGRGSVPYRWPSWRRFAGRSDGDDV